jgi:peptidoglycan-N-acetylglucosamine deacetylase
MFIRKPLLIFLTWGIVCWGLLVIVYANWPAAPAAAVALSTPTAHAPSPQAPTKTPQRTVHVRVTKKVLGSTVNTIPPAIRGSVFFQGSSRLPEVALTFDDGPNAIYTPQILRILEQYNVKATFFCIGEQVPANARILQQVYNDGDVIANHTWSHPELTQLSGATIQAQLRMTSDAIYNATGVYPLLFRPPYGAYDNFVQGLVAQNGLTSVMWNVDTRDWTLPGVNSIVKTAMAEVRNGSIILMHDGGGNRSETVEALPTIIQMLQQRGYKLVTVVQLINDTHQLA